MVIGLAERERFERLTGEAWDESRIGMTVLDAMKEAPQTGRLPLRVVAPLALGPRVRASRAVESDGLRHALLGEPVGGDHGGATRASRPRTTSASWPRRSRTPRYLRSQLDLLAKRHRHQLAEQREEMGRELMRRSFAAADLEWARRGPGSPATLAAAEYEATTSWRLTRPLRALGAMVRRLR